MKTRSTFRWTNGVVIAAVLSAATAGCRLPGDTSGTQQQAPLSQSDAEAQIQQIQSDPHMPDFAKKMSINTIRQRAGMTTANNGTERSGSDAAVAAPSPAS